MPECFAPTAMKIKLSAVRAKHSGIKVNIFTDKLFAGMLRPYSDLAAILLAKYHSPPSPVSWAIKPTRCKANVKA